MLIEGWLGPGTRDRMETGTDTVSPCTGSEAAEAKIEIDTIKRSVKL